MEWILWLRTNPTGDFPALPGRHWKFDRCGGRRAMEPSIFVSYPLLLKIRGQTDRGWSRYRDRSPNREERNHSPIDSDTDIFRDSDNVVQSSLGGSQPEVTGSASRKRGHRRNIPGFRRSPVSKIVPVMALYYGLLIWNDQSIEVFPLSSFLLF